MAIKVSGTTVIDDSRNATFVNTSSTGKLKLSGSSSGYVELQAASAGTNVLYTLPASDGLNGQVLQTNGVGSLSWVNQSGGGGGGSSGSGTSTSRTAFTATGGQTTFNVTYAVDQIDVYLNGSKLVANNDFYANTGNTIVLTLPAAAGDIIDTVVYSSQWITSSTNLYYTGGNIGVGTSSPAARIHLASANTAFAVGTLRLDGADGAGTVNAPVTINAATGGGTGNGGSQLYFETRAENGSLTERMRIDNNGRVRIGTTASSYALDVGNVAGGNMFRFARDGVELGSFISGGNPFIGSTSNHPILLMTNSTERMRIDTSGNVGIGTTSPGVNGIDILKSGGTSTYVRTSDGTYTMLSGVAPALGGGLVGTTTNAPLLLYANNAERARITSEGNLLVGTTSSSGHRFQVDGDVNVRGGIGYGSNFYIFPLPGFLFGAGSVADEYLVLNRVFSGSAPSSVIDITVINGRIYGSRGSTATGNISSFFEINVETAYTEGIIYQLKNCGAADWERVDIISISGVQYYALKGRASGGENHRYHYFVGAFIRSSESSYTFTRVRASDAGVTVVTTDAATIAYEGADTSGYSIGTLSPKPFILNSGGTERARITSGGDLGVGTTSPGQKLEVAGNIFVNVASGNPFIEIKTAGAGNNPYLRLTASSTYWDVAGIFSDSADPLQFSYGGSEKARITSGGILLVGTTSTPSIAGVTTDHAFVAGTGSRWVSGFRNTTTGTPWGLAVEYSGAAPNDTSSNFLYCVDNAAGTTLRASIRSNGGLANYQSNNVDLSDARTKKDITPAPSYWNKIGALEIVTYKYNDQTHDDVNVGVIAQQVEQVEPVWVDSDGFGETPEDGVPLKTVYTKDITFAAIKALQEAMQRIETLETELAAIKAKLSE